MKKNSTNSKAKVDGCRENIFASLIVSPGDPVKTLMDSWSGKSFGKLFGQPVESFRLINEQRMARAPENFDLGAGTILLQVVSLGLELGRHNVKQRFGKAASDLPPMRPRKG
jgi:hypothetical protein